MPTETQHLEQRVAALQSDLNQKDEQIDALEFTDNDRELSRRDWFDEAQRLERENEELKADIKLLKSDLRITRDTAALGVKMLAERDALLRDCLSEAQHGEPFGLSLETVQRIEAALSASTEPERSKCGACHGNGFTGEEPVECGTCDGRGYSAPVERDERSGFNAWLNEVVCAENTDNGVFKVQRHQQLSVDDERIAWAAWQARAALERKP